jgi:hypothetical protein
MSARAAGPAGTRQAPTDVSFGYFLISNRHPWSSTRCQCRTLSLCNAIQSMNFFTYSGDWKCRAESSMTPRQEKRGESVILRAGMSTDKPCMASDVMSCHSVTAP